MQHGFMAQVFPELRDVRITHSWTGNVAFTFDFLPHLGVHEGMHLRGRLPGLGGGDADLARPWVALKIAGANSETAFDDMPFPTLPLYADRPWFLPIGGAYYRARDQFDRLGA